MPVPQITALPDPPSRQDPTNFAVKGDAFLGALPGFATEANALATQVNERVDAAFAAGLESAATNAATTLTKAAEARASELAAADFANAAQQTTLGFATNRPKIRPSLNLDFINQEVVDPRIVVNRAGPKSYFGNRKVLGDENLVRFSEQFDNAAWAKTRVSVSGTNTQIAPDGTLTAEVVAENTDLNSHLFGQFQSAVVGQSRVFSAYLKKGSGATAPDWIQFTFESGGYGSVQYANFNLTTGVVGNSDAVIAGIEAAANGFYRCWIIATATATSSSGGAFAAFTNNSNVLGRLPSYTGATTSDVIVWGAQLETARTGQTKPTAYVRTTDYPVRTFFTQLETAAANVMPIEYDPVTEECLGIKPESAATNLLLRSEEFDNAAWTKFAGATAANLVVAPNGTLTAELFQEDATTAQHLIAQNATVAATTYIFSVYAKSFGRRRITLRYGAIAPSDNTTFDLISGTVVAGVGAIQAVGGGWYRCSVVSVSSGAGTRGHQVYLNSDSGTGAESYLGNGWAGVAIWGAQLEASTLGVPSSYIPTTSAQVTRLADNLTVPVSEFEYNQNEGTLYAEVNTPVAVDSGLNEFILSLNAGNATNRIPIYRQSAGALDRRLSAEISNQNITQAQLVTATQVFTGNAVHRLSFSFARNNVIGYFDNVSLGSDLTAEIPSNITNLDIGSELGGSVFNGYIRSLAYYPKALSALEAQALSQV